MPDFSSSANWQSFYQGSFAAAASPVPNSKNFAPISAFTIPGTLISQYLLVGASSSKTKPTWYLGYWLAAFTTVMGIGNARTQGFSIPLGLNVYQVNFQVPYSLKINFPKWHQEMDVQIWQYVGSLN